MSERILRVPEVAKRLGCCKSTVWNYIKNNPDFPRRYKVGPGNVMGFKESEIDNYIDTLRVIN